MMLQIPEVITKSPLLEILHAHSGNDTIIDLTHNMTTFLAKQILDEEMRCMRRDYSVDINKLQRMIDSPDEEMFQLGLSIINEKTKYSGNILLYIRRHDMHNLQGLVSTYTIVNKMNITGKIL